MEMAPPTTEEELKILEVRLTQLKLEYEKYFLGSRPTEPSQARSEVQKTVIRFSNMRITNTAQRFKFNSLNGRFQAFKRQWDNILRQIEAGTYKRHVFKADLRDRERGIDGGAGGARPNAGGGGADRGDLFETYRDAMMANGQNTKGLTAEKLQKAIAKQEAAIKKKYGCDAVDFKVVVTDGKVKLKAAAG
ncbi:MAG: MXAN_5187 C-terminal domain-containing protein [Myxococcota bacterium]